MQIKILNSLFLSIIKENHFQRIITIRHKHHVLYEKLINHTLGFIARLGLALKTLQKSDKIL
jgi:hypothetical protein